MDRKADNSVSHVPFVLVTNPIQFREALARLRKLEAASDDTPEAQEREALEIVLSVYIARFESDQIYSRDVA